MSIRHGIAAGLLSIHVIVGSVGCTEPPHREMDQAQGAIDAARAAGAAVYASEEYEAAVLALQRAHEAVDERDYRLALNYALDARERAQDAAREAAGQKAAVRSEAEAAIAAANRALERLDQQLAAARAARVPPGDLEPAIEAQSAAATSLEKARAAIAGEEYLAARDATRDIPERVSMAADEVEQAIARRPASRRR